MKTLHHWNDDRIGCVTKHFLPCDSLMYAKISIQMNTGMPIQDLVNAGLVVGAVVEHRLTPSNYILYFKTDEDKTKFMMKYL